MAKNESAVNVNLSALNQNRSPIWGTKRFGDALEKPRKSVICKV